MIGQPRVLRDFPRIVRGGLPGLYIPDIGLFRLTDWFGSCAPECHFEKVVEKAAGNPATVIIEHGREAGHKLTTKEVNPVE